MFYRKWIFRITKLYFTACCCAGVLLFSTTVHAFTGSVSLRGAYSKKNYGNNTYAQSKRFTGALGFYITSVTEIESSYTFANTFYNQDPIQTITTEEQILSLTIVQGLVPPAFPIQPYLKAGAAQYNRKQSGTVLGTPTNTVETKSPSGVLGAGIKIYLTRNFTLQVEAITYIPEFNINEAENNYGLEGGFGIRF